MTSWCGYDSSGRRTTVTNHEGKTTTTAYDLWDRVASVTLPDPDGAGSQTANVTSYLYDRLDRVTRVTDARNYQTNFAYDAAGNLTSLTDANGNDTSWTYDGLALPSNWTQLVNEPQTEAEVEAIRASIARGAPYGSQRWRKRAARQLRLEFTLRPRGRPRKSQKK